MLDRFRSAIAVLFVIASTCLHNSIYSDEVNPGNLIVEPTADSSPSAVAMNAQDDPMSAGRFAGKVTDLFGKPIPQARIYVLPLGDAPWPELCEERMIPAGCPLRTSTNIHGDFEFVAEDLTQAAFDGLATRRRCLVVAVADGFAADWKAVRGRSSAIDAAKVPNGTDLHLFLPEASVPVHGQFLKADGSPLKGARVRLQSLMIPKDHDLDAHLERELVVRSFTGTVYASVLGQFDSIFGMQNETTTDTEGQFRLTGIGNDRIARLEISSPEIVRTWVNVMVREGHTVQTLQRQTLYGTGFTSVTKPGLKVLGIVRDAVTKQPLPAMFVGIGHGYPRDGIRSSHETTDEHGRFEITGIDPTIRDPGGNPVFITAISSPGQVYQPASVAWSDEAPLVVECSRGIPFQLKVVDEQGEVVEAKVTYLDVVPNPNAPKSNVEFFQRPMPISTASLQEDGSYRGFAIPGPGAIFVSPLEDSGYQPAFVDPKKFFEASSSNRSETERARSYGNFDEVFTSMGNYKQDDFAAIRLVNPLPDENLLELSVKLTKSKPRVVSLISEQGTPVIGIDTNWMHFGSIDKAEPPMRTSVFPLRGLHPVRGKRLTFFDEDRRLIGFLLARNDDETPYTVVMKSWATAFGRIIDEKGNGIKVLLVSPDFSIRSHPNPETGIFNYVKTDPDGRFHIDRIIPGQSYAALIRRKGSIEIIGNAFEDLKLQPGENRNLGTIRIGKQVALRIDASSNPWLTVATCGKVTE